MAQWFADGFLPEGPDARVDGYPLTDNYAPTAFISVAYLIIVWKWFEKIKTNTQNGYSDNKNIGNKSFDFVKILMIIYNISMVFCAGFVVIETLILSYRANFGIGCVPIYTRRDAISTRLIRMGYLFYVSKIIEMLDTVFFLLRGKVNQVTFLHVFHHFSMPSLVWSALKYAPCGIVFTFPLANSFVHVIMYTYYCLSALGMHRFLWWKKHLSALQMIQFVLLILHQGQIFVVNRDCNYPKIFPALICFYSAIFLILFGNFYIQSYLKPSSSSKPHLTNNVGERDPKKFPINGYSNGAIHHKNGESAVNQIYSPTGVKND